MDYLMIGEVLKPQGIRGECKIRSYAADSRLYSSWKTVFLEKDGVYSPVPLESVRLAEPFVYAVLGGCTTMTGAEAYRGAKLYIDRAHASPLPENAEYIADLIGCRAVDETGRSMGSLVDVLQNGPVDTWVFRGDGVSYLAPALKSVFPEVDLNSRRISVLSGKLEEVAVFED